MSNQTVENTGSNTQYVGGVMVEPGDWRQSGVAGPVADPNAELAGILAGTVTAPSTDLGVAFAAFLKCFDYVGGVKGGRDPVTGRIKLSESDKYQPDVMTFGAIGDSITGGKTDTAGTGYYAYIKQIAGDSVRLVRASAENWAFSSPGYTTQQMLDAGYHTMAASSSANFVVILGGANDFPSTIGEEDAAFARLLLLAAPSITAKKRIVFVTTLQRSHATTSAMRLHYSSLAQRIAAYAEANGHILVDAHSKSLDRATGGIRQDLTIDLVHPTQAMHWWIASEIVKKCGIVPRFSFVEGGDLTKNSSLQTFTLGLAQDWGIAGDAVASEYSNSAFGRGGKSQKITVTSGQAGLVVTDFYGIPAGTPVKMTAIIELFADSDVTTIYLASTYYGAAANIGSTVGGGTFTPYAGSPMYMAPGIYVLELEEVTPVDGNGACVRVVNATGGYFVVHYCGVRPS